MGCILHKASAKTVEDIIDNVWQLDIGDEDNVEPVQAETEYIEPYQIKGQFCQLSLTSTMCYRCTVRCGIIYYDFEAGYVARTGQAKDIREISRFPEHKFSQARLFLEVLLRFSRQTTIARLKFYCFDPDEKQREFLLKRIAEFDEVAALNLPKIPVKKLLLCGCDKNFGLERFFDYEYLALYHGTQLYKELNTAKFLVITDKQENPEEIKNFKGWGLVVMEHEANQFPLTILRDRVTEWLKTGNCQYKFLCIFDEKWDIIEDSIIKWAISLEGEPVPKSSGNSEANLRKRLIHGEEEGILYIFGRTCIVFMRGDAICDDFGSLVEIGAPYPHAIGIFTYSGPYVNTIQYTKEMFT